MSKNTQFIILFSTAAIIAVVFIKYFIYYEPAQESSNTPPPAVTLSAPTNEALDFYRSKASPEEEKKHDTLIKSIAVSAPVVTISNCIPNPTVLKVSLAGSITIKNDDKVSRTLARPLSLSLRIPPESIKSFPVKDTLKKEGAYQYACDNGPGIAGIFLVTP